ncbi:MAG: hypothetical protein LBK02_05305 [Treponema sp.]|jgi:hypothetical protein|nr:hypothetical protein [Treponema sp.]
MKNLTFLWPGTVPQVAGILALALTLMFAACSNPNGAGGGDTPVDMNVEDFGPSATIAATFDIASQDDWDAALAAIQEGGNNKNYVINLTGNVTDLSGISTGSTFGPVTGIIVSLRGTKSLALSRFTPMNDDGLGSLLRIGNEQTLILRESSLVGKRGNNASLVTVLSGGSFTMRSGKISGNSITARAFFGDGVYVGGSFTMSGGEISGNSVDRGGGVYAFGGDFIMNGGDISGNTAKSGGGVYFNSSGFFTKTGGTIYGDANRTHNTGDIENTATSVDSPGHAVRYTAGSSSYFCNETLNTGDNISTEDNMPLVSGQTQGKWTKQ